MLKTTATDMVKDITIVIIDDHPLFSNGICLFFESLENGIRCISCATMAHALRTIREEKPDLILLDLNLNLHDWKRNVLELQRVNTVDAPLAILSSSEDKQTIRMAMSNNYIKGFIPKSSSVDILYAAINLIIAGGVFIPSQLNYNNIIDQRTASTINRRLSIRQKQILEHVIKGKANKVIASELHLSESTIKSHLSSAYKILNVRNRSQAIQLCKDINLFG